MSFGRRPSSVVGQTTGRRAYRDSKESINFNNTPTITLSIYSAHLLVCRATSYHWRGLVDRTEPMEKEELDSLKGRGGEENPSDDEMIRPIGNPSIYRYKAGWLGPVGIGGTDGLPIALPVHIEWSSPSGWRRNIMGSFLFKNYSPLHLNTALRDTFVDFSSVFNHLLFLFWLPLRLLGCLLRMYTNCPRIIMPGQVALPPHPPLIAMEVNWS